MIEMLGVLAIIGVLSVGGIAGYSKAMMKYRVNKTADQITQLAQNIRTLYASQKNYSTLNENVIKKAHLAPEDMYDNTNSTTLYHPFGRTVYIYVRGKNTGGSGDSKAFVVRLFNIPEEACVELLTRDWGSGSSAGLIAVGGGGSAYDAYIGERSRRDVTFAEEGVMSVDKAIQICGQYASDLSWKFY